MMDVIERPDWDEFFINISFEMARRSTCLHRQVGAVIVRDKQIVSAGYNGNLSEKEHCLDIGCARKGIPSGQNLEKCRGCHAESNAVAFAARHGNAIKDSTLYTTHFPCSWCTKTLIHAGIICVIYAEDYPDPLAKQLLNDSGVSVRKIIMGG